MPILWSLLMVLALLFIGIASAHGAIGLSLLTTIVPYAAFAIFLGGFCWRVGRWAWTPVPFQIPTTCGQEKSLPWIRQAKIENPSNIWGVLLRLAGEILLFRSLFRNTRSQYNGHQYNYRDTGALWLAALAFHWSLLFVLIRHLRLFLEPIPGWVESLERADSWLQIATPQLYFSDIILIVALAYLLLRRFREPVVRYISLFSDYFALFLILAIAITGILMRYFFRADVFAVKQYALGLTIFHPAAPLPLHPIFLVHLLLVCALAMYMPFSKLMHMGGVFLSPTRNLANDSRSRRHINPWNAPVRTHTYAEWEEEFRDKLESAGMPLEKEYAGTDSN